MKGKPDIQFSLIVNRIFTKCSFNFIICTGLKLGQIVGISIGVFIMVVLATIGILCSLG